MIRFAKDSNDFMIKRSSHWIILTCLTPFEIQPHAEYKIDTGLYFWFDGGVIALLMESKNLPPVLRIHDRTFLGRGKVHIELYNNSDIKINIPRGTDVCYLIPLVTSGYTNLEIEPVNLKWFLTNPSSIIDEG